MDNIEKEEIIREIRTHIDEKTNYPKDAKKIMKWSPSVYQMYFGKKYVLPNYRAPYYFRQDFMNYVEWTGVQLFPVANMKDDVIKTQFGCNCVALHHKRPQLFLEHELGEALLRTTLPLDMLAEDIKWKWPGFRIILPKGLLTIKREGYDHSLMFLDIALVDEGNRQQAIPDQFAYELDRYMHYELTEMSPKCTFQEFRFHYSEASIISAGMIEKGPDAAGLTTYALVKPFAHYTLKYLTDIQDELKTDWPRDGIDQVFLKKMEVLVINVLLFLSAYPLEYPPEEKHVLRKPRMEGKHHVPGLYPAKWVGQSQIRPERRPHAVAHMISAEEYHLKRHWRCGHWRRQSFGPGRENKKFVWINPYQAGMEEEKKNE
jgi:hypothetical protein